MRTARIVMAALFAAALVQGCGDDKAPITDPTHVHTLATVQVEPASLSLEEGETFQLTASPACGCGEAMSLPVTWSSADPAVATVDGNGLVSAVAEGGVKILAEATDGGGAVTGVSGLQVDRGGVVIEPDGGVISYSAGDVVLEVPAGAVAEPTKITIRPSPADVAGERPDMVGGTAYHFRPEGFRFQAEARLTIRYDEAELPPDAIAARLRLFHRTAEGWVELADSEADGDAKKVTGLIDEFSHYGVAESELPAVDRIEVSGTTSEPLMIGSTLQLTATLYDADGDELDRRVEWTSDDETVATVDQDGLVTGQARGQATLSATAEGVSGEAVVSVRGEPAGAYGNNLSHPVVFAEGIGVTGLDVAEDAGLRPAPEEEVTVDALPFFWEGNEADWGDYHMQQGPNVWQAEWADGRELPWSQEAVVAWGDNLTHQSWNTHSMIRVEHVLHAEGVEPMQGYAMTWLYGEGPDEMQGTDGTLVDAVPTVYSVMPRLTVEKLEGTDPAGEPGAPVCTVFDGALHEGLGTEGPGSYSAEVNVAGKVIYGFNFVIRDVEMCPDLHRYGWWRITFSLDEQGSVGGTTVPRAVDLVGLAAADDELTYTPKVDPATNATWLDIYVKSARGGGGGGGGDHEH